MKRRSHNARLAPLPDDEAVLAAVREVVERQVAMRGRRWDAGATANDVAHRLRVEPAQRHGRGAVQGSWSGSMSPALRMAPRLMALARRGKLLSTRRGERWRHEYLPADFYDREL